MNISSKAKVSIVHLGYEGEPVVIIDGFSGMRDELFARAQSAHFQTGGAHYPGLRAPAAPDFIDGRKDLMISIMRDVFGFRQGATLEMLAFAIVTQNPSELTTPQRIPHYDSTEPDILAGMYYLMGPQSGGTAFYRHRRTGFETVTAARTKSYLQAVEDDSEEFGEPARCYHYGNTERYEMIEEIAAQPDRLALYRGRMLHSGVIPAATQFTPNPAQGRLTMNLFFRGT